MSDPKNLRIVYMGTPDFAVEPLRRLVEGGYNVVGVVTVADKPAGRGLNMSQSAVKQYAMQHEIKVLQPEKLKDPQWIEELTQLQADIGIVVAFRMLPEIVWSMPRLGTFNLHASLLPAYRGAAPINWAIINGDKMTGVTTFFLNQQIDCGLVIDRRTVGIEDGMTAGQLHDSLMVIGGQLVIDSVEMVAQGQFKAQTQDDSMASVAPKIFKSDCKLDFGLHGEVIINKIRGLSPYPAAWIDILGTTAKIFSATFESFPANPNPNSNFGLNPTINVGSIQSDSKTFLRIACRNGWIYLTDLQLSGKKRMNITDFLRGRGDIALFCQKVLKDG